MAWLQLGFDVLEAENGLQCIDVYTQERTNITCIFLDLQMPVCDGYATTKALRQLEAQAGPSRRVPVVVCTASCLDEMVGNQTVAQRALSLGADGAVVSPHDLLVPCLPLRPCLSVTAVHRRQNQLAIAHACVDQSLTPTVRPCIAAQKKPLCLSAVQQILDDYAPGWRSAVATPPPAPPATNVAAAANTTPAAAATATAAAAPSPPRQPTVLAPKHAQQLPGHQHQLQQLQQPPQAAAAYHVPDPRSGPQPHVPQPHASAGSTPPRSSSPGPLSGRGGDLFGSGFPLSVYSASEPGLPRPAACTSPDVGNAFGSSSCFSSSNSGGGSNGNSKPRPSRSHTFQVLLGFSDSCVEAYPIATHCHPLLPHAPVVAKAHNHHSHGHSQQQHQQQLPHSHALQKHHPCHQPPPRVSRPAMSRRMSCDFSAVALLVQQAVPQPLSPQQQQQQACGSSPSRLPMPMPPLPTAVARC